MRANCDKRRVLHRRQVEVLAFLHEDRDGDLLHASEQVSRHGIDGVHRDRLSLARHGLLSPALSIGKPSTFVDVGRVNHIFRTPLALAAKFTDYLPEAPASLARGRMQHLPDLSDASQTALLCGIVIA